MEHIVDSDDEKDKSDKSKGKGKRNKGSYSSSSSSSFGPVSAEALSSFGQKEDLKKRSTESGAVKDMLPPVGSPSTTTSTSRKRKDRSNSSSSATSAASGSDETGVRKRRGRVNSTLCEYRMVL